MTAPGSAGRRAVAARLAGIGLLAAGVTVGLYVAGRLLTPDATSALFGQAGLDAVRLKSMLASIALGVAGLQVLLGAWMYRKLPLAGRPTAPGPAHAPDHRVRAVRLDRADRGALPGHLRRPAHQPPGRGALPGRLLFLRRLRRQGPPGAQQAAARLGAAGCPAERSRWSPPCCGTHRPQGKECESVWRLGHHLRRLFTTDDPAELAVQVHHQPPELGVCPNQIRVNPRGLS